MQCINCNKSIDGNSNFCCYCGLKQNSGTSPIPININRTKLDNIYFNIPNDILELLWIGDGPLKNYQPDIKKYGSNKINITSISSNSIEPSCIFTRLEIRKCEKYQLSQLPNLDYYPSYYDLSPKQRFYYLKWLEDTTQQIPIGYVFIFYYGLERHLRQGKFNLAFNKILELRKNFSNGSFQSYSLDALIMSCIRRNKYEQLKLLFQSTNDYKLICTFKCILHEPLCVKDLINIRRFVGFTNDYYIKKGTSQFSQVLSSILIENYRIPAFPTTDEILSCSTSKIPLVMANYSLSKRELNIPNIFTNSTFCDEVKSLLLQTHERIKILKKENKM